ncbi:MAG: hypothetical protein LH606_05200 [Cytophagaceae bacterium]|nr:hypothetical protein [Cytophagaceae bacterium]
MGIAVVTVNSGYGYFSMLRFLLLGERQKNVRWFMDQYTEYRAKFPKAQMDFIGHSNGTYLLASALRHYETCNFSRIVFAGSVVPTSFPWDKLISQNRVTAIRNYVATSDFIVGIFPGIFELLKLSDLGSAGHNGFRDTSGKLHAIEFIKGGHNAAISWSNYEPMVNFIISPEIIETSISKESDQNRNVVFFSKINWAVWISLLLIVFGLGYCIFTHFGLISLAAYVVIFTALLYTI